MENPRWIQLAAFHIHVWLRSFIKKKDNLYLVPLSDPIRYSRYRTFGHLFICKRQIIDILVVSLREYTIHQSLRSFWPADRLRPLSVASVTSLRTISTYCIYMYLHEYTRGKEPLIQYYIWSLKWNFAFQ